MMRKVAWVAFMLALATVAFAGAHAAEWCIPGEGCTGPEPIADGHFNTCEETCSMRNATPIRGMDANIYDVSCEGDSSNSKYRMIMGEFKDYQGNTHAYIVTPEGPQMLERCAL
jgi:hypothetical protein